MKTMETEEHGDRGARPRAARPPAGAPRLGRSEREKWGQH